MSARGEMKARLREKCADQVALDKLNGLEWRRISERVYRATPRKQKPKVLPAHGEPRPADTYRGARRNAERGVRRALALKAERIRLGESRSSADRRRQQRVFA